MRIGHPRLHQGNSPLVRAADAPGDAGHGVVELLLDVKAELENVLLLFLLTLWGAGRRRKRSLMPNRDSQTDFDPAEKRSERSTSVVTLLSPYRLYAGQREKDRSDRSGEGRMGRSAMWRAG